ncbi:helix-turn-helix domain-containing protein [Mailhella sp.]
MTLAELGARLREAREARGMTVADVADRLKIPGRILQGVEEASDRLPRTVYVHHFIKDYIKLMGFTAEEAREWTSSLEGFENISRPALSESQPFTSVKPSLLPVVLSALLKVAATALLAFAVYSAYVHFFAGRDYEEVQMQVGQEQSVPAPKAEAPAQSGENAVKAPEAAAPAAPAALPEAPVEAPRAEEAVPTAKAQAAPEWEVPAVRPEEQDEGPAVTQAMPSAAEDALPRSSASLVSQMLPAELTEEPALSTPAGQGEASPAALPEGMHHVEVIADEGDCWMGFEPDGRRQQRTLRKGDSFTMTFRDSLVMKLGHAAAVRVIYDGRELERSTSHRVMTLRFPPAE